VLLERVEDLFAERNDALSSMGLKLTDHVITVGSLPDVKQLGAEINVSTPETSQTSARSR
jgi:hypothetical protein